MLQKQKFAKILAVLLVLATTGCGQTIGGVELSVDSASYEARRLFAASKNAVLGVFQKGNGLVSGAQQNVMQTVLKPGEKANAAVNSFNESAQEHHDQAAQIDN